MSNSFMIVNINSIMNINDVVLTYKINNGHNLKQTNFVAHICMYYNESDYVYQTIDATSINIATTKNGNLLQITSKEDNELSLWGDFLCNGLRYSWKSFHIKLIRGFHTFQLSDGLYVFLADGTTPIENVFGRKFYSRYMFAIKSALIRHILTNRKFRIEMLPDRPYLYSRSNWLFDFINNIIVMAEASQEKFKKISFPGGIKHLFGSNENYFESKLFNSFVEFTREYKSELDNKVFVMNIIDYMYNTPVSLNNLSDRIIEIIYCFYSIEFPYELTKIIYDLCLSIDILNN